MRNTTRSLLVRTVVAVVAAMSLLVSGTAASAGVRVTRYPTTISLHATPSVVQVGHKYKLLGAVQRQDDRTPVYLQRFVARRWVTVAHRTPTDVGAVSDYAFVLKAPARPTAMLFRVIRGATHTSRAGVSRTLHVAAVRFAYSATIPVHDRFHVSGTPYVMTGKISPKTAGRVTLQRKVNGVWKALASVRPLRGTSYTFTLSLTAGAYIFRVIVDATGRVAAGASPFFHVIVTAPPPSPPTPVITTASLPTGLPGHPYAAALTATSGTPPFTWTAAGLPAGLTASPAGTISGTPVAAGTSAVSVTVTDSTRRSANKTLTLLIAQTAVRTWGDNLYGQLGNGTTATSLVPVTVSTLGDVTRVAGGYLHAVAVRADGTAWAWGYNNDGQLGNGTTVPSDVPVVVAGLTSVTAVAAGSDSSYALRSDGTVWAWGENAYGELGDGTTISRNVPVQVAGLTSVTAIAAGSDSCYALRSDGTVLAWGYNQDGELGNGTTANSLVPVAVSGAATVTAIAAGAADGYALLADGTVKGWGANGHDQVINNVANNIYNPTVITPVVVPGLTNVTAITGGGGGSTGYALRSDGSEWAWGSNVDGQAGVGGDPLLDLNAPTLLPLAGVTAIGAGTRDGFAVLSDGTVRAWGNNAFGELGNGGVTSSETPVAVSGLTGATAVGGGASWGWALVSAS
jgi:alpha-tubulin suppressor-like RCC1 family protein